MRARRVYGARPMRWNLAPLSALGLLFDAQLAHAQRRGDAQPQCQTQSIRPTRADTARWYWQWNGAGSAAIEVGPAPGGVEVLRYAIDPSLTAAPTITRAVVRTPAESGHGDRGNAYPELSFDGRSATLVTHLALGPSNGAAFVIALDERSAIRAQRDARSFDVGGFMHAPFFPEATHALVWGAEGFARVDAATLATAERVGYREAIPNAHALSEAWPLANGRALLCGEVGEPRRSRTLVWDFARRSAVFESANAGPCRSSVSAEGTQFVIQHPEGQFAVYDASTLRLLTRVRAADVTVSDGTIVAQVRERARERVEFVSLQGRVLRRIPVEHNSGVAPCVSDARVRLRGREALVLGLSVARFTR